MPPPLYPMNTVLLLEILTLLNGFTLYEFKSLFSFANNTGSPATHAFIGPIAITFELLYKHRAMSTNAKDVVIQKFSMVLAGKVACLASQESGWHFSASHASALQIQAFSVEDMATKLKTQAPFIWKVLGHLLKGNNMCSTSAPAPQSMQLCNKTGMLKAKEANYWLMEEERLGMQLESDAVWEGEEGDVTDETWQK
ncbi:hypothetical protein DXG03_003626 [Asterophora parasitica]|uniref:Uncharacterized protein n=1 Tax=Asterophora parasitica TaxID=117018 RepID=A0A9P7K754_9AGAR|nr:hypothetical protein DXG03_003626 [Asterophora parasitica]